jgi:hypothetical protein
MAYCKRSIEAIKFIILLEQKTTLHGCCLTIGKKVRLVLTDGRKLKRLLSFAVNTHIPASGYVRQRH